MIKVYHGSYVEIQSPDISFGRTNLDFGRGFYVTTLKEQAEKWAVRRAWEARTKAIINEYNFDTTGVCIKRFDGYTEEWLDFIIKNRQRHESIINSEYDAVYGNVADDAVARIVNYYMELLTQGRLSAADKLFFIRQLQFSAPNNQYCLVTKKAVQQLSFVNSYALE